MSTGVIVLRTGLILGMVFHKLVWEALKRQADAPKAARQPATSALKAAVKSFKSLVLVFLIVQTLFLDLFPIFEQPFGIRIAGLVIYCVGLTVAVVGRLQLGKNWANLEDFQVIPDQQLVERGIYAYIRHPIYTGDVLLILGLELALNSWLVLIVLPLVAIVVRQTLAEEAILSRAFPTYQAYRQRTKMYIPFII
ncbi:MAG: isoprenylcysteine carboxylmethyltransferase family protein [Anaerolineales bacterium]|nr:MAG: isoprenylcysteine carboxylmethyltransferase family protein [Anaerolineales bacterium]